MFDRDKARQDVRFLAYFYHVRCYIRKVQPMQDLGFTTFLTTRLSSFKDTRAIGNGEVG